MQPVEATAGEEGGDGRHAAFDQDALETQCVQAVDDGDRIELPGRSARDAQDFDTARRTDLGVRLGDDDAAAAIIAQQLRIGRQAALGVDDDTGGIGPRHVAHGQLRIVGERRADADHDRVDQGAQAMQMNDRRFAVDVMGMAGRGRNAAVE